MLAAVLSSRLELDIIIIISCIWPINSSYCVVRMPHVSRMPCVSRMPQVCHAANLYRFTMMFSLFFLLLAFNVRSLSDDKLYIYNNKWVYSWFQYVYDLLAWQQCVCVFFPSILDIKFVGRTSRGHTGGRSHRIFNPPSFCGACLDFCREKDSAIPFPRRPWSRILCTNELIVLHPLGIFILVF